MSGRLLAGRHMHAELAVLTRRSVHQQRLLSTYQWRFASNEHFASYKSHYRHLPQWHAIVWHLHQWPVRGWLYVHKWTLLQ